MVLVRSLRNAVEDESMKRQAATVETERNTTIVTCSNSGDLATANGVGPESIRAALARLSGTCECGAEFHYDEAEDDNPRFRR